MEKETIEKADYCFFDTNDPEKMVGVGEFGPIIVEGSDCPPSPCGTLAPARAQRAAREAAKEAGLRLSRPEKMTTMVVPEWKVGY